jgi:hypothetical protein
MTTADSTPSALLPFVPFVPPFVPFVPPFVPFVFFVFPVGVACD